MVSWRRFVKPALALAALAALPCLAGAPARAAAVVDSCYLPDTPFPQYMDYWQEGWDYKDADGNTLHWAKSGRPMGGYVFVYFRNDTGQPFKVTDLIVDGVKLSEGLAQTHFPKGVDERYQASILLSDLPKEQIGKLKDAGEPVWWKPDPPLFAPGAYGEIVIRMRHDPKPPTLNLGIVTDGGAIIPAKVAVGRPHPRFDTISFAVGLKSVYLYAEHPKPGSKPVKILLDGEDVTRYARIASDGVSKISPIVLTLPEPLKWMSLHNYQAIYADGMAASACIRSWGHEMVYGMWGVAEDMGNTEESARAQLKNWTTHSLNATMGMYPGTNNQWYIGPDGWAYTESMGFNRMMHYLVPGQKPLFWFLMDEPDACDTHTEQVPMEHRLGTSGQWLVKWNDMFHRKGPDTPTLLNVDGTFKPDNYYVYHQLPDIPCIDPYYIEDLNLAYTTHPWALPYKTKPTHVYATSLCSESSGRPKPLHVILGSSRRVADKPGDFQSRYPSPEEKRMEVYYAIAAGAKGLSYWWWTPTNGVGTTEPGAQALYKEIGLLGAEVRTAGPVITTSCPAELPVKASQYLWVRTLLQGLDTAAVIVVNDNVLCDRVGTVYKPVDKASVSVGMPSWLGVKDAFEVTYQGIKDVPWTVEAGKVNLSLGTVNISRFVLLTSNPGLRKELQERYDTMFAANVAAIER